MPEKIFRIAIEGVLLELRRHDLGAEELLLDGRSVSRMRLNWGSRGHHVDLGADDGRRRHLEARVVDGSKLGIGRYVALVSVDGILRARLQPLKRAMVPVRACLHCGHSLRGLEARQDELRCPECGRHTPEAVVGGPDAPGPPGPMSARSS